ncbi:hypothetical protein TSUD_375450 [Trifolium subterraneum]|uniref:Peptidase S9 prolyl oligopeptidase catalytic domain-containing protein n=1 Tax=Trifolium subterraneum TaxID=3900 RepID=A0A2Z6PK31_TRISU|nr:hypothetical protein TSUD_375450 [Trifolium subterraneum]
MSYNTLILLSGCFESKDAASQVRGSPNEFTAIGSIVLFSIFCDKLPQVAILAEPTIPIIGEGEAEANDSAEAAVEEVIRHGVAHPKKITVDGHSYGAFMTANLLANVPHLFSCGFARSGAYNRTLTPFGFQQDVGPDAVACGYSICRDGGCTRLYFHNVLRHLWKQVILSISCVLDFAKDQLKFEAQYEDLAYANSGLSRVATL